jgi:hypothetical protein
VLLFHSEVCHLNASSYDSLVFTTEKPQCSKKGRTVMLASVKMRLRHNPKVSAQQLS